MFIMLLAFRTKVIFKGNPWNSNWKEPQPHKNTALSCLSLLFQKNSLRLSVCVGPMKHSVNKNNPQFRNGWLFSLSVTINVRNLLTAPTHRLLLNSASLIKMQHPDEFNQTNTNTLTRKHVFHCCLKCRSRGKMGFLRSNEYGWEMPLMMSSPLLKRFQILKFFILIPEIFESK